MSKLLLASFDTSLERNRMCELIADRIETQIKSGLLKPGDRLPSERELAAAFAVSRTVIREALKLLEARGLLQTLVGNGVFVRDPDPRAVTKVFEIYLHLQYPPDVDTHEIDLLRRILETGIAAAAVERATDAEIVRLQELVDSMRSLESQPHEAARLDLEFHLTLAQATHNRMLALILAPVIEHLRAHFQKVWSQYDRPISIIHGQHQAIVDAVRARAPGQARAAMRSHLDYAHKIITEKFTK